MDDRTSNDEGLKYFNQVNGRELSKPGSNGFSRGLRDLQNQGLLQKRPERF